MKRPEPVSLPVRLLLTAESGLPAAVNYGTFEALANVVFFIPVGALLAAVFPQRLLWVADLLAMTLSGLIEIGQLLLLPARFASWGGHPCRLDRRGNPGVNGCPCSG